MTVANIREVSDFVVPSSGDVFPGHMSQNAPKHDCSLESVRNQVYKAENVKSLSGNFQSESFEKGPSESKFLRLPTEIRLYIYRLVHEMHRVPCLAQTLPWYPMPSLKPYTTRELRLHSGADEAAPDLASPTSLCWETGCSSSAMSDTASVPPVFLRTSSISSRSSDGELEVSKTTAWSYPRQRPPTQLLAPNRPSGKLPTALLLTSRAVYSECRTIPFQDNEFVFPMWLSSGLCLATSLTGRLADWQKDAVRWARIELFSRDLEAVFIPRALLDGSNDSHVQHTDPNNTASPSAADRAAYASEWSQLCISWSKNLRGLRLKIVAAQRAWFGAAWDTASGFGAHAPEVANAPAAISIALANSSPSMALATSATTTRGFKSKEGSEGSTPRGIISILDEHGRPRPWITHGLAILRGLRQLEIELCPVMPLSAAAVASGNGGAHDTGDQQGVTTVESAVDEETRSKIQWCADLEDALNRQKAAGEEPIKVVCVTTNASV
ncbi:uncharacterized protein B0I36DRAFT_143778 [Microdochium trichocladiopsis]|uniref:Uncharacterized protein n=1 Tax=Microdochium trichocladiopsis TaxID=1682393 RepID=A0A9P8Y2A5_9PEZI|nr:uncharacterized protein B0I36DRAFT_143778 [Microdochium trichocladiopsis]KAH7027811.1 hypothetical protein B0I36DRAFT_143778 [Microdochium trichocladiopsis]